MVNKSNKENKMTIINALKNINWGDVVSRALWTALQAFLAVVLVTAEQIINLAFAGDWQALNGLVIATMLAGITAGLSAIKTVMISVVRDIKSK